MDFTAPRLGGAVKEVLLPHLQCFFMFAIRTPFSK